MLWIDFVNSLARDPLGRDAPRDRLDETEWRRTFAATWSLPPLRALPAAQREGLRRLRGTLLRIARAAAHALPIADRDVRALNRQLQRGSVRPKLRRQRANFHLDLVPQVSGGDAWMFAIARSCAEFLVEHDTGRLRISGNSACGWVFYDSTRSRTRRWCAPASARSRC